MIPPAARAAAPRRRLVVALALALLCWAVAGAQTASAHAELVGTVPAQGAVLTEAPDAVELRFNESVHLIDGAIRLFTDGAGAVELAASVSDSAVSVRLPAGVGEGTFTVAFRVVSADGHPVSGALAFQVGPRSGELPPDLTPTTPPATEALFSGLAVLQYLGLLLFAGLVFFEHLVLGPGSAVARGLRRLRVLGLGLASVASVLAVPAAGLRITGSSPWQLARPGAWWPGVSWPPVQAAACVLLAGWAAHALVVRGTGTGTRRRVGVSLLAALAVAAPVLVGHTRTVGPGWLMAAADVGHLLAGAFWLGGLVGLLVHLGAHRRPVAAMDSGARGADVTASPDPGTSGGRGAVGAAGVVVRFSRTALVSVLVLAASGLVMGVLVVGSLESLVGTTYGRALMLKFCVVVTVVALAAWNRVRLLPAIARHPDAPAQWAALLRILRHEAALLVAVVVITGFLANTSPNHQHAPPVTQASGTEIRAESQGLTVEGIWSPSLVGGNEFTFRLLHDGAAVTSDDVTVSARLRAEDLGPLVTMPDLASDGTYTARVDLPAAGQWEIQVSARVSRFEQPNVLIPVEVR